MNDLVDWDRIASMIATAIANNGGTNPSDPGDGGTDPGDGGTDPGDGGNTGDLLVTRWTANGVTSPIVPTGHMTNQLTLETVDGATPAANGNLLVLNKNTYLAAENVVFGFTATGDDSTTQAPTKFRIGFKGILGVDYSTIVDVSEWSVGQFTFSTHWNGTALRVTYNRNGDGSLIDSDDTNLDFGNNHLYEVEYSDDPTGAGGFMTFFYDGTQIGAVKPTATKLRISDNMDFNVNATLENSSGSVDNLVIEYVELSYQ